MVRPGTLKNHTLDRPTNQPPADTNNSYDINKQKLVTHSFHAIEPKLDRVFIRILCTIQTDHPIVRIFPARILKRVVVLEFIAWSNIVQIFCTATFSPCAHSI